MPAWSSSSLAVSESHNLKRHKGSGLLLNGANRHSKQHMVEKKMFRNRKGMHGKDFQIGRKFSKKSKLSGDMKSSSISPSVEEFDRMMSSVGGSKKKTKMFSRKQFG